MPSQMGSQNHKCDPEEANNFVYYGESGAKTGDKPAAPVKETKN